MDRGRPIVVETLDTQGKPEMMGLKKMEEVTINPPYPEQTIKVEKDISAEERKEIIELLRNSLDIFTWVFEDMQRVDREVAEHQLNVDPRFTPTQQRAERHQTRGREAPESRDYQGGTVFDMANKYGDGAKG